MHSIMYAQYALHVDTRLEHDRKYNIQASLPYAIHHTWLVNLDSYIIIII